MWTTNITITNNTNFEINIDNNFTSSRILGPNGGDFTWATNDFPNVTAIKFFNTNSQNTEFQGGLLFGQDCGVWADRGYMETPTVVMDVSVNNYNYTQELNGGKTITDDFSMGGNILLTFRNKL